MSTLFERLETFLAEGRSESFDDLARDVLDHQLELFPAWKRLQGNLPAKVAPPAVRPFPAELFKNDVAALGVEAGHVFETSGTGSGRPGRVAYSERDLELMRRAIDLGARRHLFPDGPGRTRILVLAPPPTLRPGNIMAWGMQRLIENFSVEGGAFLFGATGPDVPALLAHCERAMSEGTALTLIGASFGFVHLMDALAERGQSFELPAGSRLMDAGGTKGRSREISREGFRSAAERSFGIPAAWQTNLLGMTELGSQFYDQVVGSEPEERPLKRNGFWTRTWAVDPATLVPLPAGEPGLLVHLDLANLDHPALLLTQDVGAVFADGFEIAGRAAGADARGCSLALEEFLDQGARQ